MHLRDKYSFEYGEDNKVGSLIINDKCKIIAQKSKELIYVQSSFTDWHNNTNVREIPISSRGENHISAYDGRCYVDIRTPSWKRVGSELSQARATLLLRNTSAYIQTSIIARASQGC